MLPQNKSCLLLTNTKTVEKYFASHERLHFQYGGQPQRESLSRYHVTSRKAEQSHPFFI